MRVLALTSDTGPNFRDHLSKLGIMFLWPCASDYFDRIGTECDVLPVDFGGRRQKVEQYEHLGNANTSETTLYLHGYFAMGGGA